MRRCDLHVHSTYSDGKSTPREIALTAIKSGIEVLGFSDHSYTFFDESYCMKKENVESYLNEINALKREFSDKIEIRCGIEQDYYSEEKTDRFDYVIGSVHYVLKDGEYIPVDEDAQTLKSAIDKHFSGDALALCEEYYKTVAGLYEKTGCDIVGHIDLITKFNGCDEIFDTKSERYINAYKGAVDRLVEKCSVFEINTGAISRGYKKEPYPSAEIVSYIKSKGGTLILSSDSHSKDTLLYGFEKYNNMI